MAADRRWRAWPTGRVPRTRGSRGSALLLVPAGFVAFLVLAALAFDQSRLFAARRELIDVAASAANDAVAVAVDQDAYRRGERPALDTDLVVTRAEAAVTAALAARGLDADEVRAGVEIVPGSDGPRVVVRLESDVVTLFARLAPGGYRRARIAVAASATLIVF